MPLQIIRQLQSTIKQILFAKADNTNEILKKIDSVINEDCYGLKFKLHDVQSDLNKVSSTLDMLEQALGEMLPTAEKF